MQGQQDDQLPLFDTIDLETLIPEGHLLRRIDKQIDFDFIYELTEQLYSSDNGRPSIDPVLFFSQSGFAADPVPYPEVESQSEGSGKAKKKKPPKGDKGSSSTGDAGTQKDITGLRSGSMKPLPPNADVQYEGKNTILNGYNPPH